MNLLKCTNLTLLLLLFFFISFFTSPATFSTAFQRIPVVEEVIILSGREGFVPTNFNKIVEFDEKINLYALLKSKEGYYFGYEDSLLPDEVKINDKTYSLKEGTLTRWNKNLWGKLNISWYKVMPRMTPLSPRGAYKYYSNVFSEEEGEYGAWRGWQIIEYEQIPLKDKGWSIRAEKEAGTVRWRAELTLNGKLISSPGKPDSTHPSGLSPEDYDRGIKDTVHRISRLSNHKNKLIRYIEALRGVPWLWGATYRDPPRNTPSQHQADFSNPVGIDCADLVISALRAMGNKQLDYTSAENLVKGKYTYPLRDAVLTYHRNSPFKDWIPRGIAKGDDKFFVYGRRKIQIRDNDFNLIKEIKIRDSSFKIVDITISNKKGFFSLLQKNFQIRVGIIKENGEVQTLFIPEIKKSIHLGEKEYFSKVSINPTAIQTDEQLSPSGNKLVFYLLSSDAIYVFSQEGKELLSISLEGAYTRWTPAGSFSVEEEHIYVLADDRKTLVYNLEGEKMETVELEDHVLDIEVREGKIFTLSPFPLKVRVYNLSGSFMWDYTENFLYDKGKKVRIKIGESEKDIQVGDLFLTISPTYHTLLFYQDNGNHLLDGNDEVITAGHRGVEIRKVSYFEGRKFVLRRFKPKIKIE